MPNKKLELNLNSKKGEIVGDVLINCLNCHTEKGVFES